MHPYLHVFAEHGLAACKAVPMLAAFAVDRVVALVFVILAVSDYLSLHALLALCKNHTDKHQMH